MQHLWLVVALCQVCQAYLPATAFIRHRHRSIHKLYAADEAQALIEKAAQLRAEIAQMEGKSVEEVEKEAEEKKNDNKRRMEEQARRQLEQSGNESPRRSAMVELPNTAEDMVRQAARAVERAFEDGKTRQTVRFNLISEDQSVSEENQWPGGAKQMYREAAKPLTEGLLREVRASTSEETSDQQRLAPNLVAQDIWDFDGSALHTAEASEGPTGDIQALVFPNTDTRYIDDINTISESMGKRLFLLVNPFWRNIDSWSFNLLAPNAPKKAQETIFDNGYDETYNLMVFQVRGEKCAAIKSYPNPYVIFGLLENQWGGEDVIRLGTIDTGTEPTSAVVTEMLNTRPEFKETKTMRQMKNLF